MIPERVDNEKHFIVFWGGYCGPCTFKQKGGNMVEENIVYCFSWFEKLNAVYAKRTKTN